MGGFIRLVLMVGIIIFFSGHQVYAYIDLGSGSYFFQILIATLLGFLFLLKMHWRNILSYFKKIFLGKQKNRKK